MSDNRQDEILQALQSSLTILIEGANRLAAALMLDGDVCEESQQACLRNALYQASHIVNGITVADLKGFNYIQAAQSGACLEDSGLTDTLSRLGKDLTTMSCDLVAQSND